MPRCESKDLRDFVVNESSVREFFRLDEYPLCDVNGSRKNSRINATMFLEGVLHAGEYHEQFDLSLVTRFGLIRLSLPNDKAIPRTPVPEIEVRSLLRQLNG
ncbi:MAG: hypothetical protein GY725_00515 [bacterium]|nr:hypothetical protein [bacterium]